MGKDQSGAGIEGRDELFKGERSFAPPGRARLLPRGLRLYDLHRQQRTAAGADFRRHPGRRSRCMRGPLRQPKLRRPDSPAGARQLSRFAAARRCLCVGGPDGHGHHHRTLGQRPERNPCLFKRHLADAGRGSRRNRQVGAIGDVQKGIRRGLRGRRALEEDADT